MLRRIARIKALLVVVACVYSSPAALTITAWHAPARK
jgi:hypothetical protein